MIGRAAFRALLLCPWIFACGKGAPTESARTDAFRHLILISLDTTRADHLGCYGDARGLTPAIDSIAAAGAVFEQALAPAPTTLASHTSILTGTWPQTNGVVRNGFVVHKDNELLAERLSAAGFHTAAFIGSFALDRRFGLDQGFDVYDTNFEAQMDLSQGVDQHQRRAGAVVDAALQHLDRLEEERLFLFLHFFDAHSPYDPPPPFDQRFAPQGVSPKWSLQLHADAINKHQIEHMGHSIGLAGLADKGLPLPLVDGKHGKPIAEDLELAALYAGEIAYLDSQLGRLFAELERRGILQEALVVITADHGETFFEHGDYWSHGVWVYDTTVHVPLILAFPDGRFAGKRYAGSVSTIDITPTVLELLGLKLGASIEGQSLLAPLQEEQYERGPVFSQATKPGPPIEWVQGWGNLPKARCVRLGRFKYVLAPYLGGKEQLFDLATDPREQRDLLRLEPRPAEVEAVRVRLRSEIQAWVREQPGLPSHYDQETAEQTRELLKQMQYSYGGPEEDGGK